MTQATKDREPQDHRLRNVFLLFGALWRLVRGQDRNAPPMVATTSG